MSIGVAQLPFQMPLCGGGQDLMVRVVVTGPPLTGCTSLVTRLTRDVFPEDHLHQQRQQTARIDIGCQVCIIRTKEILWDTLCNSNTNQCMAYQEATLHVWDCGAHIQDAAVQVKHNFT